MVELVVTRHAALVDYLLDIGLADSSTEIISHATAEAVAGKNVAGVLPHSLSVLTASYTEVPLSLPAELRGVELNLDQVRQYAGEPRTYKVRYTNFADSDVCQFCGSSEVTWYTVPCDNPHCEVTVRECSACRRTQAL